MSSGSAADVTSLIVPDAVVQAAPVSFDLPKTLQKVSDLTRDAAASAARLVTLTAELDKRELLRARYDFDPVGHYSRSDVFQLLVDEPPKSILQRVA